MKKILIYLLAILIVIPYNYVFGEDGYSEWSPIPSGYPGEEEAIQYGVIFPKTWSDWNINQATDPIDLFFQKSYDFGSKTYITYQNDKQFQMNDASAKSPLYSWDFGEEVTIKHFYIDVDCWKSPGADNNFISPAMQLYVDGKLIASVEQKDFSRISENWEGDLNVQGSSARLDMSDGSGSGRDRTTIVYSYLETSLIKFSHVIEWEEATNWRFDTPYELLGGENAQKPAERKVYRYPLKPKISVDKRYLYEDSTIDDIKNLASALDYNGKDITSNIVIKKLVYDDNEKTVDYPDYFDPYLSDTIRVTYYVKNQLGAEDSKTVKLYILRDGEDFDFKIYDRYISDEYMYTLDDNSMWKDGEYKEILKDAMDWLERK